MRLLAEAIRWYQQYAPEEPAVSFLSEERSQ
jgi:hypothetical protein